MRTRISSLRRIAILSLIGLCFCAIHLQARDLQIDPEPPPPRDSSPSTLPVDRDDNGDAYYNNTLPDDGTYEYADTVSTLGNFERVRIYGIKLIEF